MKRITFLFAVLFSVFALNAATVSFGSAELSATSFSKGGVTVTPAKADGEAAPAMNVGSLRLYANNTLTFDAGSDNIKSITITLNDTTNGKRLTTIDASVGEVEVSKENWKATWANGGVSLVVFTIGEKATLGTASDKAGQIHILSIDVETDGEGDVPGEDDKIDLGVNYVQWVHYPRYSSEGAQNAELDMVSGGAEDYWYWLYLDVYYAYDGKIAGVYTHDLNIDLEYSGLEIAAEEMEYSLTSAKLTMRCTQAMTETDWAVYLIEFEGTAENGKTYTAAYHDTIVSVSVVFDEETFEVISEEPYRLNDPVTDSSIEEVSSEDMDIRVVDGAICVDGQGEPVSVYSLSGMMLYATTSAHQITIDNLHGQQVVIVRVGNRVAKVLL